MNVIDFSQHSLWNFCQLKWYERYVKGYIQRPTGKYQDNALTFGSLTHAGLENWGRNRNPEIQQSICEELNTSPEFYLQAQALVNAYVRRYPEERWEISREEEPLLFPIGIPFVFGLAKIDRYFYVPETTTVESGIPGHQLTLSPGWWIHEYKTKDAKRRRDLWDMSWASNMQAAYQLLALKAKLGELAQGILVQVLEKPPVYIPKRKCKGCGEMYELASFIPTGRVVPEDTKKKKPHAEYSCPICGHIQVLNLYESKVERHPDFYRLIVQRTPEQLAIAKQEIRTIALLMDNAREEGPSVLQPNRNNCVTYYACEYFRNHTYNEPVEKDPRLILHDPLKYTGLVNIDTEGEV